MSDEIPLDVVTKILLRCDIPTIFRCRCVSKNWAAIIDGSHFIKLHTDYSINTHSNLLLFKHKFGYAPNPYGIFHCTDLYGLEIPNQLINSLGPSVSILGSFNGLLCLFNEPTGDLAIINPSTQKQFFLPTKCNINKDEYLLFGPYGFGYDCDSDDYKIVLVYQKSFDAFLEDGSVDFKQSEMHIFCVKSRAFKVVKIPYCSADRCAGVLAGSGRALHWLMHNVGDVMLSLIVYYHFGTDEIRELPNPKFLDYAQNSKFGIGMGILESCLSISVVDYVDEAINFWVMKEEIKDSWTKLFSFPLAPLSSIQPQLCTVRTLGFLQSDSLVLLDLFSSLVWCNKEDGSVRKELFKQSDCIVCLISLAPVPSSESGRIIEEESKCSQDQKNKKDDSQSKGSKIEDSIQDLHL